MNGPSEEARYLASWLVQFKNEFADTLEDKGFVWAYLNEENLAECIQQYFNSRQ